MPGWIINGLWLWFSLTALCYTRQLGRWVVAQRSSYSVRFVSALMLVMAYSYLYGAAERFIR